MSSLGLRRIAIVGTAVVGTTVVGVAVVGTATASPFPSSTCSHNMVNFGPLTAEIISGVWGIPANFNGFRVLAALLHGSLVVGVSHTLRR